MNGKYLDPSTYCESNSQEIIDLSRKITKNSKGKKEAAKKIFDWVREEYKWYPFPIVGAKALLGKENKIALCTDKTNLFIALCRAAKIHARYVQADCFMKTVDKNLPRKSKHFYSEVFVENEWVIADPAFGRVSMKLFETSVFGKPTWTKQENIKRLAGIPRIMFFLINLYIKHSGFSRKVRAEIERLGY